MSDEQTEKKPKNSKHVVLQLSTVALMDKFKERNRRMSYNDILEFILISYEKALRYGECEPYIMSGSNHEKKALIDYLSLVDILPKKPSIIIKDIPTCNSNSID